MRRTNSLLGFIFVVVLVASGIAMSAEPTNNANKSTGQAKDYSEVFAAVTDKINVMAEEVDYLDDQYEKTEAKWQKYKTNISILEQITRAILADAKKGDTKSLNDLGKVKAGLEKIHRTMPAKFPSGAAGPGRFGAYYTQLKYTLAWDRPQRVGHLADVVVRFDDSGYKFVFWRGTNYVPCWVTENQIWYTDASVRRRGGSGTKGNCEPMSDKQNRYCRVRVLESNNARVVVHWRYSPVDIDYHLCFVDGVTNWGDWVDEFYTIYPDGIGIRKAILHTSAPQAWAQWQEAIVVNQPHTKPEDNIELTAVTAANLKGQYRQYRWTEIGAPEFTDQPEGVCIQMVNLKAAHKPFLIVDPQGAAIEPYRGRASASWFTAWDHWPVSQDKSSTRVVTTFDKPSSTSLSHMLWRHYARQGQSDTKIMMQGLTEKDVTQLVPLAKSWLHPPKLNLKNRLPGTAFINHGYDKTQRAYVLSCKKRGKPSKLQFTLAADADSPVVNPAFVIKNWGQDPPALKINGENIKRGKSFRFGHRHTLEGSDLIVWLKKETLEPVVFTFTHKDV